MEKNESEKSPEITALKFGIFSDLSPILNIPTFFKAFFEYSNAESYFLKSETDFCYNPKSKPELTIYFHIIREISKIKEYYSAFDSFLIMLDLVSSESLSKCENIIDALLDASDYNVKKLYFFAFYKEDRDYKDKINEFLEMIAAKDIEYEFLDLNVNNQSGFSIIMRKLHKEAYAKAINNAKDKKHSDIAFTDQGKSKCSIY